MQASESRIYQKILRRIIPLCALILIVVAGLLFMSRLLMRKESADKYASFFREAADGHIDMLILGSSHVINGVSPIYLWDNYGYTSYNMGGHGSLLQSSYWELRLALNYCHPQVVLVDSFLTDRDYQYLDEPDDPDTSDMAVEQLHLNMDAFPMSAMKREALTDLIHDPDIQASFSWPLKAYHARWLSLTKKDFSALSRGYTGSGLFGSEIRYGLTGDPTPQISPGTEPAPLERETVGARYLRRIIEVCMDEGIQVIVTQIPFNRSYWDESSELTARAIAEEYGVDYIELPPDMIDIMIDGNDDGHLNLAGMYMVSDRIGEYLSSHTSLTDHRRDAAYSDCYETASRALREELSGELSALYDPLTSLLISEELPERGLVLYLTQDSGMLHDERALRLIERLSGTDTIRRAADVSGPYILIREPGEDGAHIYEAYGDESLYSVPTALGHMNYMPVERYFCFLYSDEEEDVNLLYDESHLFEDIRLLYYNADGDTPGMLYYMSNGMTYERRE